MWQVLRVAPSQMFQQRIRPPANSCGLWVVHTPIEKYHCVRYTRRNVKRRHVHHVSSNTTVNLEHVPTSLNQVCFKSANCWVYIVGSPSKDDLISKIEHTGFPVFGSISTVSGSRAISLTFLPDHWCGERYFAAIRNVRVGTVCALCGQ